MSKKIELCQRADPGARIKIAVGPGPPRTTGRQCSSSIFAVVLLRFGGAAGRQCFSSIFAVVLLRFGGVFAAFLQCFCRVLAVFLQRFSSVFAGF